MICKLSMKAAEPFIDHIWEVDLDIVWKTAKERVPELKKQLQALSG